MSRADELLADLRGVYSEGFCVWCRREHDRPWFRPMDIGATDASHHSRTLATLVKRGDVLRRERGGRSRPAYMYRRRGLELCPEARAEAAERSDSNV